ncbi:hypothetical protein HNP99_001251 [Flavobacterium sp. 28A]|uniref:hypothetical protein n=1 Tax=Flavobacterium sp. 28A TaxID=2735895 RepID=UPI00156DF80F|nr:hypothetical protein [Flavobacterium sp. 28A]NRT14907.1 hypothetical protein [Flavobacterium sp. 28A]
MKNAYLLSSMLLILISCGKEEKEEKPAVKGNVEVKSVKNKKEKKSYISQKWKKTKEVFSESDSVIQVRKEKYFTDLNTKYSDYKLAEKWFSSNPHELMKKKGDFYKMIKSEIDNNNTIEHVDLSHKSSLNSYKYLFVTEDEYLIYDLKIENNRCNYVGVRRIKKGFRKEPVHDLIFDKNGNLGKEIYQGEVKQDMFTKDGHLFFEFEKDSKGQNVKNTIDLGIERNF